MKGNCPSGLGHPVSRGLGWHPNLEVKIRAGVFFGETFVRWSFLRWNCLWQTVVWRNCLRETAEAKLLQKNWNCWRRNFHEQFFSGGGAFRSSENLAPPQTFELDPPLETGNYRIGKMPIVWYIGYFDLYAIQALPPPQFWTPPWNRFFRCFRWFGAKKKIPNFFNFSRI